MGKELYIIQSDVDDVVTPANTAIRRAYNRAYGTDISYQDGCELMLESTDLQMREFARLTLRRPEFLNELPLYPGVIHGSALLQSNSFRLDLVSGRLADLRKQTIDWVVSTGLSEYCSSLYSRSESEDTLLFKVTTAINNGINFAIEDHPKIAQGYAEAKIFVALIRRPWNIGLAENRYIKPVPSYLRACKMILSHFSDLALISNPDLNYPERIISASIPLSYTQSL